jgi:hypothetical protein
MTIMSAFFARSPVKPDVCGMGDSMASSGLEAPKPD